MAVLTMAAFAAACSTSTSDTASYEPISDFPSNRLEIPISYNDTVVHVSIAKLRPGDYYGSVQIKSDLPGRATVNVPVHATIQGSATGSGAARLSSSAPGDVSCSRPVQSPRRQTTSADVRWVRPPPARAEAGVGYPVSFYGWIKQGDDGYIAARVDASDTENLLGDAPINFEAGDYRSLSDPIEGTLRFESCTAQTVYVFLRWYSNDTSDHGKPVRVEVSPPSGPRPILTSTEIRASTVEGPNSGPIGTIGIRSLCDLAMRWRILNSSSWLDVSPEEGVENQTVTLTPGATILAPGEYRSTLIVSPADGGHNATASVRFTVSPVRLQWDPAPPSAVEAGEEILATIRGVPGFKPYSARLWLQNADTGATDYYRSSAQAVPRPDGSFIAPLRLPSCSGGRFRLRAEAYGSSGRGEAAPAAVEVRPAEGAILDVYPSTLSFYAAESATHDPQELTISLQCGGDSGLATLTASQPWILLEDQSNERQDYN